jgi:hypothetical protein
MGNENREKREIVEKIMGFIESEKWLPSFIEALMVSAFVFEEYDELIRFWSDYLGEVN